MESDRTHTTSSDGVCSSLQKTRPLLGRTSGPTRRSTKGQWTPEEDETLFQAVQRFNGKNWKKIAECFKDRTDVQCLHRWQKVLNPELVKGPWSKEEDEIIVELVGKHGPKKWSTIAQHLPGRIGKQCRERWHNHLNPAINKEAWTQEEELALIRAHQIYGNKWAELTKFLPGRSDNSIKNHWNSSVKKKLDSYLASGLLERFQGLPHVGHPNQSLPSSMRLQQSSGDDNTPKDGPEADEFSECSQDSSRVGCSQSTGDMAKAVINMREECRGTQETTHGKGPSSSPASCSEDFHTALQEVALSMPGPSEFSGSSMFFAHDFSHGWGTSAGQEWQLLSNEIPNISSLDGIQESSALLTHSTGGNENHEIVLETSASFSASTSMENMTVDSDKSEHMLAYEDGCCRVINPETGTECFNSENMMRCSDIIGIDGSADPLLDQSSNYQIPAAGTSTLQPYHPMRSDTLGTSFSQCFPVPSQHHPDDGALVFGIEHNQTNALSTVNQEEILASTKHGFIYTNESGSPSCVDGTGNMGLEEQPNQAKDCAQLVPVDDFHSDPSNNIQTSSKNENTVEPNEQQDGGALFYEPPRFPSLDVPFFSCDLIQPGSDMQQEYSPLGIRQLMMSSVNCFTPFRLWDSPSRDDSPDAVLKSAARSFACTPSILKKRHRDLVSPLSEKRCEKKLESDVNEESFSSLTRDFSRLEVIFDKNENQPALLPRQSSNQKGNSGISTDDKENVNHTMVQEEGKEGTALFNHSVPYKEFDRNNLQDKTKQAKTRMDTDATAPTVHEPLGVLVEQNVNDRLFFSPDQLGFEDNKAMGSSARIFGNLCTRSSETGSNQGIASESLSLNPCSSVLSPRTICGKDGNHLIAVSSVQSTPSSTSLEILVGSSGTNAGGENSRIFGETPFKRSIESPSAWKSPWFFDSFLPGPKVDTDITIEDIGYFLSPGDRSYDAIGLMKQLSEHTAAAFADAQEVLGHGTHETILKGRYFKNQKADQESSLIVRNHLENCSLAGANTLSERRTLDFSECGTPEKGQESGKSSTTRDLSSASSYMLKGCR